MEDLHAEVTRGSALDVELARELGRPRPERRSTGAYAETLSRPGARSAVPDHALVVAAQGGDPAARTRLVEDCLPLVASVARIYRSGHVSRQELLQEGVVGLLRALERFDAAQGTPFWAYAAWWVRQAMQQLVSELTRPVVLSDRALRHLARLKDAHRSALQHDGREPSRTHLAQRSHLTLDQVDGLLATERPARSLDEPALGDDGELGPFGELLVDPLGEDAYEAVLRASEAEELHALLAGLSDREREVLRARYGIGRPEQSLREVGAQLGLSAERVRQIEQRALVKLASESGVGPA